jgi:hypothetical protein
MRRGFGSEMMHSRGNFARDDSTGFTASGVASALHSFWLLMRGVGTTLALLAAAGCRDGTAPDADAPESVSRDILAPAIASQLDANGRFPGALPRDEKAPIVSRDRAYELARAFMKTFGASAAVYWSEDAGRTVSPSQLRVCDRLDFVESPYETFHVARSTAFRNTYGPQWLVRFCERSTRPLLEMTIAANATIGRLNDDGTLPVGGYSSVFSYRIVLWRPGSETTTVEAAVNRVSRASGVITELPRLVGIGAGISPTALSYVLTQRGSDDIPVRSVAFGLSSSRMVIRPVPIGTVEVDTLEDFSGDTATIRVQVRRKPVAVAKADLRAFYLTQ